MALAAETELRLRQTVADRRRMTTRDATGSGHSERPLQGLEESASEVESRGEWFRASESELPIRSGRRPHESQVNCVYIDTTWGHMGLSAATR